VRAAAVALMVGGMRVAVVGASGFIGQRLCVALERDGHDLRALTRKPGKYDGAGTAVGADVSDPASLGPALRDADAAY
jgi:uncharacterized protein YbjT (DUF2867 family)